MKAGRSYSHLRWIKIATPGLAALVLIAMVGLSYRQWEHYRRANAEAEHSREVLTAIDNVQAALEEADRGERGYLLTGESRYLTPYNAVLQEIPSDLAKLKNLLGGSQQGMQDFDSLNTLASTKLEQLHQAIVLRRTEGLTPAIALVLNEQVTHTLASIRDVCAQMRRTENARQVQASLEGEAAAGTVLLATAAGALVLLFLFAFGLEPFASPEPLAWQRPWPLRYGAAVLAVAAVALFRAALTPLIGATQLPFTLFFFAVAFAAWFGGFRPAGVSIALSLPVGSWFFAKPTRSLWVSGHDDQVAMLMIVVVGFAVALLTRSQTGAVERALRSEDSERSQRQRFETTLTSIGDAVIATDARGQITFVNQIASALLKWPTAELKGRALDEVFRIVNEVTRAAVESPVARVLREGKIVGLANHTSLIGKDGTEVPIDDSAAPIVGPDGSLAGVVLVFRDVTEARKAQEQLSEQAALLEHAWDAVIVMSEPGPIGYWNSAAEKLYGWSSEEAIGKVTHELLRTKFPEALSEIVQRTRRDRHWQGELVHTCKDGRQVTVLSRWAVLPGDESSGPCRLMEINTDITARKFAEQALTKQATALAYSVADARSQHDRLRGIIDSAMDAIITIDESQRIRVFNRAAEQVFRCPASYALDQPLEKLLPERFREAHQGHIELFGRSGVTTRSMLRPGTLWGLRADGEEFPLEASISQIEMDGERLFTVILRDITERKCIEDDLHRERERLGLALTTGKMGVYEMNLATKILWWSPETYSLFGIKPEEFLLTHDSFAELIHPADRELFMQHWDENIAQSQPVNHEFRILLPDSKERWLSCKGLTLTQHDDSGQALRHTGVFLDITERKDTEQALRKFEKLSAAARLSAAIAHEINNPLTAALNLVYIAKAAPGVPEPVAEQLALAEQELERVAHAARQSLGFYRESAPSERIDIPALIDSVLRVYSGKVKDKKIQIRREFAKPAWVYAVRGELRQVVSNLVINAIEAVGDGGNIVVGCCSEGPNKDGVVEIVIADDGHGIAPEHLDHIFEPFFSTKPGTGTGLGLWAAKEIVERHSGSIDVKPGLSDGRGATFAVRLPSE